ncbi:hypothetical protein QVD17_20483 [Tagetes erecta]|uniref:Uncharacterized protein n=1 Tax=Tagetes erecta TaxID=13708 RepID=A0AAD8KP85_TARER|nr:hypothetical protein QVD17_20483 [Tagetes erecta]
MICSSFKNRKHKKFSRVVVNELGGQYEEVFNNVKLALRNRPIRHEAVSKLESATQSLVPNSDRYLFQ